MRCLVNIRSTVRLILFPYLLAASKSSLAEISGLIVNVRLILTASLILPILLNPVDMCIISLYCKPYHIILQ